MREIALAIIKTAHAINNTLLEKRCEHLANYVHNKNLNGLHYQKNSYQSKGNRNFKQLKLKKEIKHIKIIRIYE